MTDRAESEVSGVVTLLPGSGHGRTSSTSARGSGVAEIGAHDNMTPAQALALSLREAVADGWDSVLIITETPDGEIIIRSSGMPRASAAWLAEKTKLYAMGILVTESCST